MKNLVRVLSLVVLVICFITMTFAESEKKKFNISLGGFFPLTQTGYAFWFTDSHTGKVGEVFIHQESIYDTNRIESGFNLGSGFFVVPNVEITADMNYFKTKKDGRLELSMLNSYAYDNGDYMDIVVLSASDETVLSSKLTEILINLGINYHFPSKAIDLYMGAGITYLRTKIDLLEDVSYVDKPISYYHSGWDYTIKDATHEITIEGTEYKEIVIGKFGFNVRSGVNFPISNRLSFFFEQRYHFMPKKEIPHFLTEKGYKDKVIDLGFYSLNFGIRIFL